EERAGTAKGTRYTNLAFQPDVLEAIAIDSTIGETAPVDLPDGTRTLTRIDQVVRLPGAPTKSVAWIDADENIAKLIMPVMGYELTLLACSKECAMAANQSTDILVHSLVQAPRALGVDERTRGLKLRLRASDGGEPLNFARTDEQDAVDGAGNVEVTIAP